MRRFRRLLFPIGAVLGTLICAYAAFFVGVKDELPSPPGSFRLILTAVQQKTIVTQWPETIVWRSATVDAFILPGTFDAGISYYRDAYLNKRGWKEISQPVGQPTDVSPAHPMTVLSFAREDSQVIIAFTSAQPVLAAESALYKAIPTLGVGTRDWLALLINGKLK
jgi:hypothetical protein